MRTYFVVYFYPFCFIIFQFDSTVDCEIISCVLWGVKRRRSRYQKQLVVLKISVSGGVAKIVTLGFVIVIKATSSKLSWISMNTGAIPDPGFRHGDKDKDKYDNRLILLIILNSKLPMRM